MYKVRLLKKEGCNQMNTGRPIDSVTQPTDKAVTTVYDPRVTYTGPTPGGGFIDTLLRLITLLGKLF